MQISIWILLLLIGISDAYKILCLLPYSGKSHHMVFEPIIQELTQRGHKLTVVSFFPSKEIHQNRRDISLVGLAPINLEIMDLKDFDHSFYGLERYWRHIPLVQNLAKSNLKLCERILDSEVFREFLNAEGDYDLIMLELFNSDCMLGIVNKYGLPTVGLMSSAFLPWTFDRIGASNNPAYVPVMGLTVTEKMNFLERVENTFFLYYYLIWFEMEIRWKEQKLLEEKLGQKLPPLEDVGRNVSVILINTYHVLNGVPVVPPSVREIGGVHLHNKTVQPLSDDLERWVSKSKDGVILFSFGSLIRGSTLPENRIRAVLKVFARLPQRVLWKWEADLKNLPENVRIVRWLPQYDLLNHPKCVAFITHAGLLSLTEALSAGVPLLTVPVLGDQFSNAAQAHQLGIAEVLQLNELDEERIYEKLKKVLTPAMRSRAKRVSRLWKDRPLSPMAESIYYIEKTAYYKGLNLSSHSRFLSTYQLLLLDVIAFFAVILAVLFLIVRVILSSILVKNEKLKKM